MQRTPEQQTFIESSKETSEGSIIRTAIDQLVWKIYEYRAQIVEKTTRIANATRTMLS